MQREDEPTVPASGEGAVERSGRWPRSAPFLVALAFLVLQILGTAAVQMTNDGYRYARTTLQILGETRSQAEHDALVAYCSDQSAGLERAHAVDPSRFREPLVPDTTARCVAGMPQGLTPNNPRYEAIFDARVGYPLLAAPLVALLGVKTGLYLTSLVFVAVGGLLAYVLLRSAGAGVGFALLGQIAYAVSPLAFWGSYPLTDGTTMAATMGALLGGWWMIHDRRWAGLALLLASLLVVFVVRYSSMVTVSAALAVAGLIALISSRPARHIGTSLMIALNVVAIVAAAVVSRALGWPGLSETLQDTFTRYFTRPDVSDPWARLAQLNVHYWSQWLQTQFRSPFLLIVVGVAVWALFRYDIVLGALVTAIAVTGPLTVVAHPVVLQDQRLMEALWVAPVIGIPVLLMSLPGAQRDVRRVAKYEAPTLTAGGAGRHVGRQVPGVSSPVIPGLPSDPGPGGTGGGTGG